MSKISQLTKNISAIQKLQLAIEAVKSANWKSTEVREVALQVRNTFDTFEQEWRDLLEIKNHKFFVFCIPRYAVLDGPPVFQVDRSSGDEINQKNFENNCPFFLDECTKIKKAMQDERANLLNLQNQGELSSAFQSLDAISAQLNRLTDSTNVDDAINEWDENLQSQMKKYGLNKHFNTVFGDSSKTAADRIKRRETALNHIADNLCTVSNNKSNGGLVVNLNNSNVGIFNTGDNNDFQQIAVNINTLAENHQKLADAFKSITAEIENTTESQDTKEQAADAVLALTTELAKPVEKQRKFKIEDPWKKLETLAKVGDLAIKVQPLLPIAWEQIVQHLPHFFG